MIKKELQQELNRTKLILDYAREEIKEKDKEIERLNNIINELEQTLEKLIKEQLEQYNKREENWEERKGVSNTWLTSRDCYYSILKYLQKLKGVDKE